MSTAVAESSAAAALTRLDGYMAASGYDSDHPWRAEIATTLVHSTPTGSILRSLTPDEVKLVAEFRSMNQWSRDLLRDLAEGYAVDFPAHNCEPGPTLAEVHAPGADS